MSLFEYCQRKDYSSIEKLIKEKCNLNEIDDQGRSALHHCCEHDDIQCLKLLYENDCFNKSLLNLQDYEGCSALHLACLNGQINLVKYLCEQGADVTLVDNESRSLIHWITVCEHLKLFDIVMKYGAPIHTADNHGAYPIHYASQILGDHDLKILKKLLDYQVNVNCLDQQKRTPFLWAASAGALDTLRILYKVGADPFHVDKDSLTAIHWAAMRGHASCIRLLVQFYGCSLESEDANGCTALFYAVTLHHSEACQVLLDLKANPNHQDKHGRTPSHCAAFRVNLDCLKRLIQSQANIWIRNQRGNYPIHELISKSNLSSTLIEDFIRYIFQLYPKSINIRNRDFQTLLHLAASLGSISLCQILISCGAKINSIFQTLAGNYITPYDLACIRGHQTCANYLLYEHGGQRGNFLVNIFVRRIQRFIRQIHLRKLVASTTQLNLNQVHRTSRIMPIVHTQEDLLNQANICLENKRFEDQQKKTNDYLVKTDDINVKQSCHVSKIMLRNDETNILEKVIIHTANSISTSVKLYERHKLIAEELFKIKQAKIYKQSIIINRPLYKILIENAFNPQNRQVEEIEKYLETLLKAYETELEAIRKRTKSLSPRRVSNTLRINKINK